MDILRKIVTSYLETDRMTDKNIGVLKKGIARLLRLKGTRRYADAVEVRLGSFEKGVAYYSDGTIFISNPARVLWWMFLTKSILVDMFLVVFAHEMVHAWQSSLNAHTNASTHAYTGAYTDDAACVGEAHANYVARQFAKEHGMLDAYNVGVHLLETYHFWRGDLARFRRCYVDMPREWRRTNKKRQGTVHRKSKSKNNKRP
jgi:hypothetical protein